MGNADLVHCKITFNFTFIVFMQKTRIDWASVTCLNAYRLAKILTMVLSDAPKNKKERTLFTA